MKLLSAMLALWSAITALGALATGYRHLFMVRMGVGAAESASSPACSRWSPASSPTNERASAMGVVFSGLAIGTGIAFAVGGLRRPRVGLARRLPGCRHSRRDSRGFYVVLLKEPKRTHAGRGRRGSAADGTVIAFVGRNPTILFCTCGAAPSRVAAPSVWVWTTPVLVRQHGFSLAEAGVVVGISAGLMKFISTAGGGFLADWVAKGRVDRLWIVPSCALTLSVVASRDGFCAESGGPSSGSSGLWA